MKTWLKDSIGPNRGNGQNLNKLRESWKMNVHINLKYQLYDFKSLMLPLSEGPTLAIKEGGGRPIYKNVN